MLWSLVQPPERGGLGMAPSEASRLTLEDAHFYLADEDELKYACRRMNEESDFGRVLTVEERRKELAAEKTRRRKYFTGSEELK